MNLYRLEHKLPIIWYQEMAWYLAFWKQSEDYAFLNQAPSQSLQQTAKALDRAFRDAFDKRQSNKRLNKREAGIKYPQHMVLDQGWGEFCRQLEYKQEWRGGMVLFVDSRHTSQTCPICGHLAKGNRLTQETFRCLECFFVANADSVASQNILSRGLGFLN